MRKKLNLVTILLRFYATRSYCQFYSDARSEVLVREVFYIFVWKILQEIAKCCVHEMQLDRESARMRRLRSV